MRQSVRHTTVAVRFASAANTPISATTAPGSSVLSSLGAVDPVALANERFRRPSCGAASYAAASSRWKDPMDGPCGARGQDAETESAGRDSPEKDEVEDQHGIEIVEMTADAEQHIADESEDAQRNHGAHAERGKHARRCGVWFLPPITAASRSACACLPVKGR